MADLPAVLVGAEAQRGVDDPVVLLARARASPVAVLAQEAVDEVAVDAVAVGRDLHAQNVRALPTRTVKPCSLRFRQVTPERRRKMQRRLFLSPSSFTVPPRM